MSTLELVLNMLAEATTTEISRKEKPESFHANKAVAVRGGRAAGDARKRIEKEIGGSVITNKNAAQLNHIVTAMLETSAKETGENAISAETEPDHKNNEKQ